MTRIKLSTGKLQCTGVLEKDGSLITDRDRIVDRAQELHSSDRPDPEPPDLKVHNEWSDFPMVEPREVELAITQSNKGTAPEPYNITIDLIEAAGETIYMKLAVLFNECLRESKIPEEWNKAIIILLYNTIQYKTKLYLFTEFKFTTKNSPRRPCAINTCNNVKI